MGKVRIIGVGTALAITLAVAAAPLHVQARPASTGRAAAPAAPRAVDDDVHLNEIQTVGSHNSYKVMPSQAEDDLRRSFIGAEADLLEYRHAPLPEQFESQKVRQIELDVFLDPAGGKFSNPLLRSAAGTGPYEPAMADPGIKVLHVQDVDYMSTCLSLKACLTQVEAWSDANPSHVPIAVLVELKDGLVPVDGFPFVVPDPFDATAMDTLDAEIRAVMDPADMITPDDVRGARPTVEEAVLNDGWPTLGESRGKVLFLMDNGGGYRTDYLAGHPNLEGRAMFTNANPGDADAAFLKRNNPNDPSISGLVSAGYVVRTRSDGGTEQARANDTTNRDAALASGAQWVSTDYPVPDWAIGFTSPYFVEIPGGTVARCNPVNGPEGCVDAELDRIFEPVDPPVTTPTTPTTTPTTTPGTTPTTLPPGTSPASGARPITGRPTYTG